MRYNNIENILIGISSQIKNLRLVIPKIAKSAASIILISGDTGTGKELVSRLIHANSSLHDNSFFEINCSSFSGNLYENIDGEDSEVDFNRIAEGGTIFFDEITDLDIKIQAKLLKFIENDGSDVGRKKKTDLPGVRFIFATNKDLEKAMIAGSLRMDLYYRLNVIALEIPSLRDRLEDIVPIAKYYLSIYAENYYKKNLQINKKIEKKLLSYTWPGNIRELKHVIERFVLLDEKDMVLPQRIIENSCQDMLADRIKPLDQIEMEYILRVMDYFQNNKSRASKALGISRQSLINKFKKYQQMN